MRKGTLSQIVKVGLHFYGIWPYLKSTVMWRLYWIMALSTAQVFQYNYVVVNSDTDNFSEFMDGLGSAMASSLLFIKLGLLWINQRMLQSLGEPNAAAILVKSLMFYVTMNLDVFVYCFAGEYLSAKGRMIGDAAYNSLWYDVSVKKSRIMMFIIMRSQKRLTITYGRIMEFSLECFTNVLKTSVSYMSVLIAMY
ncbi:odorant receptor 67c-like [Odontomachus brunneus]|uniref:odorant receptor 67c-like n=1 Tax=Odontomachus brunneus TaxID=486640 RepID=UPI0013F1FA88|nr:odorant receptor 67c-like [Odontomachus brunneus]